MTENCPIDCKTATTPESRCKCSCDGDNHGIKKSKEDPLEIFETVNQTIGFTINDIDKINPDSVFVLYQEQKRGWIIKNFEFVQVKNNKLILRKEDGCQAKFPETRIPSKQFDSVSGTLDKDRSKYRKEKRDTIVKTP